MCCTVQIYLNKIKKSTNCVSILYIDANFNKGPESDRFWIKMYD